MNAPNTMMTTREARSMPAIECLGQDELERFATGRLDDSTIEQLGEHLGDCETCRRKADAAFANSDLAVALHGSPETAYSGEEELLRVQSLLARQVIGPSPEDEIPVMPAQLGPYRLTGLLGKGGMGIVYLAEDSQLGRQVALKVMKPKFASGEVARRRFIQEARSAARLTHDHIVPIYQVGEDHGVPYIAMPLLAGRSLDDVLKQSGRLPTGRIIDLGCQIAEGLKAAHEAGLIHRDIKPANIWIEPVKDGRVKILDFGLARCVGGDNHLTQSGVILGTPEYMAPEQAQDTPVDHRCDLFSLGCVLYRMATGVLPFTGKDTMSVLMALATKDPVPPHRLRTEIPEALSGLIMRLLEKDPARRPQTADEVIRALTDLPAAPDVETQELKSPLAQTTTENSPVPETEAFPRAEATVGRRRRRRGYALLAGLLFLVLAAGAYQLAFKSKDGTLIVEVDGDADLRFKNGTLELYGEDGSLKYTLEPGVRTREVRPGTYLVRVSGADGVKLETDRFEMEKKGVGRVRVTAGSPTVAKLDPVKDPPPALTDPVKDPPPSALTEADIKRIAALPAAEQVREVRMELKRRNPGFVEELDATFEDETVTGLEFDAKNVADISPLRALPRLRTLSISNGPLTDLNPLNGMKLRELEVIHCHELKDLTPLRGMPLEILSVWNWAGTDLRPLEGMPLKVLNCGGGNRKLDLAQLAGLPLESLYMNSTQVSDLTPLKKLPLKRVHCADSSVSDLTPLRGLKLIELNVSGTAVADLSPLRGMPLSWLQFQRTKVTDLSLLRNLPLTDISFDFEQERDIPYLLPVRTLKTINNMPAADWLPANPPPENDPSLSPTAAITLTRLRSGQAANPGLDPRKPWTLEAYVTPLGTNDKYQAAERMAVVMIDEQAGFGIHKNRWYAYSHHNETEGPLVVSRRRVHVAVVRTPTLRLLFVEGKLAGASNTDIAPLALIKFEPTPLKLDHFNAEETLLSELRVSQTVRYEKDFKPPARFETDKHTLALYHLDEGKGSVFMDSSGNNHHGKLTNAKWFVPKVTAKPKTP